MFTPEKKLNQTKRDNSNANTNLDKRNTALKSLIRISAEKAKQTTYRKLLELPVCPKKANNSRMVVCLLQQTG